MLEETTEWQHHFVLPWTPVRTQFGKRRIWYGLVMRRRLPSGDFEYRELTPKEWDEETMDAFW